MTDYNDWDDWQATQDEAYDKERAKLKEERFNHVPEQSSSKEKEEKASVSEDQKSDCVLDGDGIDGLSRDCNRSVDSTPDNA
jgi:hypothetical protein